MRPSSLLSQRMRLSARLRLALLLARVLPALGEALLEMRPTDRRTIVAQGPLAYGRSGLTWREKPGERHSAIAPDAAPLSAVEWLSILR